HERDGLTGQAVRRRSGSARRAGEVSAPAQRDDKTSKQPYLLRTCSSDSPKGPCHSGWPPLGLAALTTSAQAISVCWRTGVWGWGSEPQIEQKPPTTSGCLATQPRADPGVESRPSL